MCVERQEKIEASGNRVQAALAMGLLLLSACIFLPGVEFRPRYGLTAVPLGLLIIILASVFRGVALRRIGGRFVLTFAIMFCYEVSSSARLSLPAWEERWPWLLPWSTMLLVVLVLLGVGVWVTRKSDLAYVGKMLPAILWCCGSVLACALAVKGAISWMALSNEVYRTPDWLEPKFHYYYLVYRSVEYSLLALLGFTVPDRAMRPLGFGVALVLLLKTAVVMFLQHG